MTTYILGTGIALPGAPVDNDALHHRFGIDPGWVDLFVGTRTRHLGVDLETGRQTHTVVDLGEQAARRALAAAGIDPVDVDGLVLATATPDTLMPSSATGVAERLGLRMVPAYQVQSGCAGAVQALDLARRMLDEPDQIVLVVGVDVCAKHMVLASDTRSMKPGQLVNYMLFGDGAGAAVLTGEPAGAVMELGVVLSRYLGVDRAPGQVIEWFGDADRDDRSRPAVSEDYKAIEEHVPAMARSMKAELTRVAGWADEGLDYLLPPQLSGKMTPRIREGLGAPGATEISCVAETGNSGNALPFLQLDRLADVIAPGERGLAVAIESSRWIEGGFTVTGVRA